MVDGSTVVMTDLRKANGRILELAAQLYEAKKQLEAWKANSSRLECDKRRIEELGNELLAEARKEAEIAADKLHRISRHVVEGAAKIIKAPREPA